MTVVAILDATGQALQGLGVLLEVPAKLFTDTDIIESNETLGVLELGLRGTEDPGDIAKLLEAHELQDVRVPLVTGLHEFQVNS